MLTVVDFTHGNVLWNGGSTCTLDAMNCECKSNVVVEDLRGRLTIMLFGCDCSEKMDRCCIMSDFLYPCAVLGASSFGRVTLTLWQL